MTQIRPAEQYESSACAILIIGAGTSGLTTALELALRGADDVLVVDHGGFNGFEHRTRTRHYGPLPASPVLWRSASDQYPLIPGVVSPVGGRSLCWDGVVLPVDSRLLAAHWPKAVAVKLLGDGSGSYAAAIRDLDLWRGESVAAAQSAVEQAVRDAWNTHRRDAPVAVTPRAGRSRDTTEGREHWVYSPLGAWQGSGLHRHRGMALPIIMHGLQALRLLVSGGRVTGALFGLPGRATREIAADSVVLAAGTFENTRLYAQALALAGERLTVWRGLQDHVTHGHVAVLPTPLCEARSAADRAFLWANREADLHANLFIDIHAAGLPEPIIDIWWMSGQETPFADEVRFETTGDLWSPSINARLSGLDTRATRSRNEYSGELLESFGVPAAVSMDRQLDISAAIREALATRTAVEYFHPLGIADHEAGTVALGDRLEDGGRSPQLPNLFLVGPATFPLAGAANPTLTILALAAQTADIMARVATDHCLTKAVKP